MNMIRPFTFWFLSLGSAFFVSLDLWLVMMDVEPGKNLFFAFMWLLFELAVIRKWGPKSSGGRAP